MRTPLRTLRTLLVIALAVALLAVFLRHVDLARVGAEIVHARPEWLVISFATGFLNLAIRSYRWRYLLEPLGRTGFGDAFRATAVGFAASTVLPARAGEVIRPYFLARTAIEGDRVSATGAFATIVVERILDTITVLTLLASYLLVFGRTAAAANHRGFAWLTWVVATAAAGSIVALVVVFVLAGDPERLGRTTARLARIVPSVAALLARVVEQFARGLAVVRRPARLFIALLWSFPLWITIGAGIWTVAVAFRMDMPFTGTFAIVPLLALGVTVPTPGAVGGFHTAFRYGATTFFDAPDETAVGAAIVAHLLSVVPSLLLGFVFAAQAGLNLGAVRDLAQRAERPTV
jgi:glycosyltransferase 2 family protein